MKNKYLEILTYILQNNQLLNLLGDDAFHKDIDNNIEYNMLGTQFKLCKK
jgi:hypothetical protein